MLIRYTENPAPGLSELGLLCNTEESGLFSNVRAAVALGIPAVDPKAAHAIPALICGSGPSLADTLESIREKKSHGATVFALNNAAKFLTENGIECDYQVVVDPRAQNVSFLEKPWAKELLIASQCAPEMFVRAKEIGYPMRLWHPAIEGIGELLPADSQVISCHHTIGLTAPSLIWQMGYRSMHLYGYDSSHRADAGHAFAQPMNASDELVRVAIHNRAFTASMTMAGQISGCMETFDMLAENNVKLEIHGDGALPHLYRTITRERTLKFFTAHYDLGVSPPSYDFLAFLVEAERHRRSNGFDSFDVVFQPGPMHGFRDDNLPPDNPTRHRMLWNVCVPMAKLMPTVRNITVLAQRQKETGEVFPPGYEEQRPKAHYGVGYLRESGERMLAATEDALRKVPRYRYATITLRDAPHWGDRNSNMDEWIKVADWLWKNDIQPIWIPDADGQIPESWMVARDAARDLDLRCALYEKAVINLGVLNGPMSLPPYLGARYLICKVIVPTAIATTKEFLAAQGYAEGDGFGGNGKLLWTDEKAETIIEAMQDLTKEKTS